MSDTIWNVYHLYDVVDRPYEKLDELELNKCDNACGGLLAYIGSTEGVVFTNPSVDEPAKLKNKEDETFITVSCAKKVTQAIVAVKSTTHKDGFYFYTFDTKQLQPTMLEVPKDYIPTEAIEDGSLTIYLNDDMTLFAYVLDKTKLVIFSAPFDSKPLVSNLHDPITNVLFTHDPNNPARNVLFATTENEITYLDWGSEGSKIYKETKVPADGGAGPHLCTIKEDGVIMVCRGAQVNVYDAGGQLYEEFDPKKAAFNNQGNAEEEDKGEDENNDKEKKEKKKDKEKEKQKAEENKEQEAKEGEEEGEEENKIHKKKAYDRYGKTGKHGPKMQYILNGEPIWIYWIGNALLAVFNAPNDSMIRIFNFFPPCIFGKAAPGDNIRYIFQEWNSIIVVRTDNSITRIAEVDMTEKINSIIKNEQFDVALAIAASRKMTPEFISMIHRRRADSYYAKHKFDLAIDEYIQTIGFLEASYVITRFIDPQYAEFLVKYLEGLQAKGMSNKQHTTLLFNCYTKLRKEERLKYYIEESQKHNPAPYDVATAVEVLNLSGYRPESLELAKNYGLNMEYARMLAEDHCYSTIFEHLKTIGAEDVTQIVKKYGLDIIMFFKDEREAREFTSFLADCCCDGCPMKMRYKDDVKQCCNPDDFLRVFLLKPQMLVAFIDFLAEKKPEVCTAEIWNAAIESIIFKEKEEERDERFNKYFNFTSDTVKFEDGHFKYENDQVDLFLKSEEYRNGLMNFYIKDDIRYYEEYLKLSRFEQIPKYFEETYPIPIWRQTDRLWRYALKYLVQNLVDSRKKGDDENIATLTLSIKEFLSLLTQARIKSETRVAKRYFEEIDPDIIKDEEVDDENRPYDHVKLPKATDVIEPVEVQKIDGPVAFLDILEIISMDKKLRMGYIKDLARAEFKARQSRLKELQSIELETENEMMREDVEAYKLKFCHYKANQTRCKKCNGVIDLPAKHFLCGHSYHIECLGENINMCIHCQEKQKEIIQRKLRSLKKRDKRFENPNHVIAMSGVDPLFALSSLLQSDVMREDETAKVKEVLTEYTKL